MANDNMELIKVKTEFYSIAECPVCMEYMSAPIVLCATGHNICNECRKKVENCPSCRKSFTLARNFSLEKMVENMEFPCRNFGCEDKMFLRDIAEHDKTCPYRLYQCLIGKGGCTWKCRKQDFLIHAKHKHNDFIICNEQTKVFDHVTKYRVNIKHTDLISAHAETFWFQRLLKPTEKTLYISVHYIGASENCSKYLYKLHFVSDSKQEIHFALQTHPVDITIEDIIEKEIGCFSLKSSMAKHFIKDNSLQYIVEIIKVP